jgi:aspartate/methionine/tyrosine aminotransferase
MAWAKSVPLGARFDLTASGVPDALGEARPGIPDFVAPAQWNEGLDVASLTRRDVAIEAQRELVDAVARRYDLDASCVAVTLAASTAILHALIALVRAGDHVVVERPTYEALRRAPEILGAMVSRLERRFDEGWAVVPERLAQLLTPRTRAVILTNLHNPSGVAIDNKTMKQIAELAARVGAMLLVDEVYLDYCDAMGAGRPLPAAVVAKNGVSWSSTTKAFGFSAIRAGWVVTPDPDVAKAVRAATDYLHVTPPVATARLGARVLSQAEPLAARSAAIASAGREVLERWLDVESRVQWVPPAAGITCFLRLPSFMSDTALCEHLRQRYDTQLVPGSMFEQPGFVRLGFGLDPTDLEQALKNVSSALDDLA